MSAATATTGTLLVLCEHAGDATALLTVSGGDAVVAEFPPDEETGGLPEGTRWDTIVVCPVHERGTDYRTRIERALGDIASLTTPGGTVILDIDDAPTFGRLLAPLVPLATGLVGGRPVVRFGRDDDGPGVEGRGADGVDWTTLGGISVELTRSSRRELVTRQLLEAALAREDRLVRRVAEACGGSHSRTSFPGVRRYVHGLRRFAASGRWWLRQQRLSARRR